MYAIAKLIGIEDVTELQESADIFYAGEATGNPHFFSTLEDADEFRETHQLNGQIIKLPITT